MKLLRVILPLILIVLLTPLVHAHPGAPKGNLYRITTVDNRRFTLFHGTVEGSALTGRLFDGRVRTIPRDSIMALEVHKGSHARKGMAVGGFIGAFVGLTVLAADWADQEKNPEVQFDGGKVASTLIITTGSGVAVGAAFGALFPKWQSMDFGTIWLGGTHTGPGLTLTLHF